MNKLLEVLELTVQTRRPALPMQRESHVQMQVSRENGLCYNCNGQRKNGVEPTSEKAKNMEGLELS